MDHEEFTNVNGVINEKKLLRILYSGTTVNRVRSVPSPDAQINSMYAVGDHGEQLAKVVEAAREMLRRQYKKEYYIFILQELNGLRISEVLNIRCIDITSTGLVMIKGLKGSKDRVIATGEAKEYLLRCRKLSIHPFVELNRFHLYRVYKKVGLVFQFGDNTKKSVTHAFRHIVVKSMKDQQFDILTQKEFIGHKSENNTIRYGKNQKKSNDN